MARGPLIASSVGQRAAVAALMGVLLAGSMAGAYAFTRSGQRQVREQERSRELGSYTLVLGPGWAAADAGPLGGLLEGAHLFRDAERPSRLLLAGMVTAEGAATPVDVVNGVMARLVSGPVQPHSVFTDESGPMPRVEVCVRSVENGRLMQRQIGATALSAAHSASGPARYAVLYMEDAVEDMGTFQQNQLEFHAIHESLAAAP